MNKVLISCEDVKNWKEKRGKEFYFSCYQILIG